MNTNNLRHLCSGSGLEHKQKPAFTWVNSSLTVHTFQTPCRGCIALISCGLPLLIHLLQWHHTALTWNKKTEISDSSRGCQNEKAKRTWKHFSFFPAEMQAMIQFTCVPIYVPVCSFDRLVLLSLREQLSPLWFSGMLIVQTRRFAEPTCSCITKL